MITRDRLTKTDYGRGLLTLFQGLRLYRVMDWGNDDSGDKSNNRPEDRREVNTLDEADVVSSLRDDSSLPGDLDDFDLPSTRHALVLDIDHPSWLIPSTSPGHYHLYIDVPEGITDPKWRNLMVALAEAGVIEKGYKGVSLDRGFSCVRMPWVEKRAKSNKPGEEIGA